MHWEYNNRNTAEVGNYLMAELGIDKVFFAGDLLNGQDTLADGMKVTNGWLKEMSAFDAYWYAVRGNHDGNSTKPLTNEEQWADYEYHDNILKATKYGSGVYADRSAEGLTVSRTVTAEMGIKDKKGNLLTKETDDCLFYYMDDAKNKIRYYFLDDGNGGVFPKEYAQQIGVSETSDVDKCKVVPFEEQLKWVKYTATQGADPLTAGWGIVGMTHRGLNPSKTVVTPTNYSLKLAKTFTEVENAISGVDAFCILSAHTHYDGEHYNEEGGFYTVAISNDADTRSGIQQFLPELDQLVSRSSTAEMNTNNRLPGTDAEQLMDIVQFDRANRKVYMTRVGDGFSRTYDF
jgi:hypothetical protein